MRQLEEVALLSLAERLQVVELRVSRHLPSRVSGRSSSVMLVLSASPAQLPCRRRSPGPRLALRGRSTTSWRGRSDEGRGRSRERSAGRSPASGGRSEEHTSELQSRVDLVCRLLLEK